MSSRYFEILGCTGEEIIEKLSHKAGEEIDHIIPKSIAMTIEEVRALNHISNLRLVISSENQEKRLELPYVGDLMKIYYKHPNPDLVKKIVQNHKEKFCTLKPSSYIYKVNNNKKNNETIQILQTLLPNDVIQKR